MARRGTLARSAATRARAAVGVLCHKPRALTGAAAGLVLLVAIAGLATTGGGTSIRHVTLPGQRAAAHQLGASRPLTQNGSLQQAARPAASLFEMTSSNSAVYQVTGPISVVLNASGPCWIQARRSGPSGGLLFQGTVAAGQTWTVAGPTWLRLGDPTAVNLTVNGEVLSLPASQGTPFDLQIG